jgi:cyanophycinase
MRNPEILDRFISLAGGPTAPVVIIPTAGGAEDYDQHYSGARRFRERGIENVTVLHTKDRQVADSEEFVRPIRQARAVWLSGGRQWRLADSYLGTRTLRELEALLARGGVIGGSSAGATIQGSYLARGDTKTNTIMMGDHTVGFGFLSNTAIDQHLLKRNRQFDLIEIVNAHPKVLGIGLDEDTAIVVSGNSFEVIGSTYVAIYDRQKKLRKDGSFYLLAPGDRFDLGTRTPMRRKVSYEPIEGLFQ